MRHPVKVSSQMAFEALSPRKVSSAHLTILIFVREANVKTTAFPDGRPICRKMVAKAMGLPFHAVSGRFTELLRLGLLEELDEPRVVYDGRRHAWLRVTPAGLLAAQEGNI